MPLMPPHAVSCRLWCTSTATFQQSHASHAASSVPALPLFISLMRRMPPLVYQHCHFSAISCRLWCTSTILVSIVSIVCTVRVNGSAEACGTVWCGVCQGGGRCRKGANAVLLTNTKACLANQYKGGNAVLLCQPIQMAKCYCVWYYRAFGVQCILGLHRHTMDVGRGRSIAQSRNQVVRVSQGSLQHIQPFVDVIWAFDIFTQCRYYIPLSRIIFILPNNVWVKL